MYFDRFDIVEAYFVYFCEWHSGQWSEGYRRLCKIMKYFTPGKCFMGRNSLSDNGKEIYDNLVATKKAA